MNVSDLTEDQAKEMLDILAKQMGLEYSIVENNMFFMVYEGVRFTVALDSPREDVRYKSLCYCHSYVKVLETIIPKQREDIYTMICIPGVVVSMMFHAIKRPHCLEELMIMGDIES